MISIKRPIVSFRTLRTVYHLNKCDGSVEELLRRTAEYRLDSTLDDSIGTKNSL